jgi:hypothetical protein
MLHPAAPRRVGKSDTLRRKQGYAVLGANLLDVQKPAVAFGHCRGDYAAAISLSIPTEKIDAQ